MTATLITDQKERLQLVTELDSLSGIYPSTGSLTVTLLDAAVQQLHSRGHTAEGEAPEGE